MKAVSNAYKSSMKSLFRNRSYVEISFKNIDTKAATDGVWDSNGEFVYSKFNTLEYEYEYQQTAAVLELNRWALDGNTCILPPLSAGFSDGFISNFISDSEGNFGLDSEISKEFTELHDFPGLTLTFDTRCQEWPESVTIKFWLNGKIIDTITQRVTGTVAVIDAKSKFSDKISISFGKCLPYRRPRLESILYGAEIIFRNENIVSTDQSHDVDPLSRRSPIETLQFVILDYEHKYDPDNPVGIYSYIDKHSPISIQFGYELPDGTIENLKPDNYLLNGKPTVQNNQATFTCTGLIGSLTGTFYKSKLGEKNFYDMAEEVLLDAGLPLTKNGTNPWEIDDSLKQMFTTAALPIDTHMNCLQLIAHACRCRLFTDDDNIIHIKPFGVTVKGIYSGTWSDNGHLWYSEWGTIDKGNSVGNTYTTLELNRWVLDGSNQIIIPDKNPSGRGYVSEVMSNDQGLFETPPVITRMFDVSHDFPFLNVRFDNPLNEYPSLIQIKYYKDDIVLDTQTVKIESTEALIPTNNIKDCNKIEITILEALPHYRVRVSKVYYRDTDFTLDFTSIGENSQKISKIDQLKTVSVAKYSYVVNSDSQKLFEGTTEETQLHIEFSEPVKDVEISITNGSLISSSIYARAVDLELSSGTKNIEITGKSLSENSVVVSYPVAIEGEIDKEENPLITNDTMCNALADHVKKYLTMRNTYEAEYRGNPELEVGDIIGLQTMYTDEMNALILVDGISFNGSLSGKMTVKGLI